MIWKAGGGEIIVRLMPLFHRNQELAASSNSAGT